MTRVWKGSGRGGKAKLACTRAKAGAASHPYRSVPLDLLQEALERDWLALIADVPAGDAGGSLDAEHSNLSAVIDVTGDELERLVDLCAKQPSQSLASRIRAIEAQLASLRRDLADIEEQREIADHGLVMARTGALANALSVPEGGRTEPLDIARANAALRSLFAGITVDYPAGVLAFNWRQGGWTDIRFAWPEVGLPTPV